MIIEIKKEVDPVWWNTLVKNSEGGTFFQTTYWSDYLSNYKQAKVFYLIARSKTDIKGICLFWIDRVRTFPYSKKKVFSLLNFYPRIHCFYGPLLFDHDKKILENVFEKFEEIGKKEKVGSIKEIILPIHFNASSRRMGPDSKDISSNYNIEKRSTYLIDLNQDLENLRKSLKASARKCLKKAEEAGIKVSMAASKKQFDAYDILLDETSKRIGLTLPYYQPDMRYFLKEREKCIETFVAEKNGIIHGGLTVLFYNRNMIEIASAQSDESIYNRLYVNDSIKWEVIKWGKRNNFKIYDLGGISASPKTQKERNIRQFKEKWGGQLVNYVSYSRIYRSKTEKLLNLGKKIAGL